VSIHKQISARLENYNQGAAINAQKVTAARRQLRSSDLLGAQREVLIEHAGEVYLLRQTSKGKLILTK